MPEKVKILAVDDAPGKLLSIEAALAELDEEVVPVNCGEDALRCLLHDDFAVILLDVNMPGMDGYETAAMIRRHPRCEHVPIIFITAHSDEMHSAQGYSLGAVDYILAPVAPSVLRTKVRVFVELYKKNREISLQAEQRIALLEARAAAEAAERANQAKSAFLANVSHELRTPMNSIIGMTQLTLDEELPTRAREYLEIVHDSARHLLGLLNEILDFSRLEAGKFSLSLAPFRLRHTLDETMKAVSLQACAKGLEVLCMPDRDVPDNLVGDALRLRQVLLNLIGNAIKFTERGEVLVRVGVESQTVDRVRLQFAVSDTGIGIPLDQLERIFEPFTQVDASSTRRHAGSGLGLSIAASLTGLMEGRVWAESTPGVGSTFYFTATFALEPARTAQAPLRWPPARVLLAEPHAPTRQFLERVLTDLGLTPDSFAQPEALSARLSDGARPQAAIFDAPGLGPAASDLIAETRAAGVPCIVLGTQHQDPAAQFGGALRYLAKPLSQDELTRALGLALSVGDVGSANLSSASPRASAERPLKVLLVDDTPANQKLVKSILERRGHLIQVADNGRRAIELVEADQFDVVLMDVQMPEMDGFEATELIRKMPAPKSQLPILALTAHAMMGDDQRCLTAGMDAYIPKPIDRDRVVALVEHFGSHHGAGRPQTAVT